MNDFKNLTEIKEFLDIKYQKFNNQLFIDNDPIQIPHLFTKREDIEISGFLSASIAWGMRKTIIKNARFFIKLMDDAPYDFIMNLEDKDLERFDIAKHRTLSGSDLKFFIKSLNNIYKNYGGLRGIFYKSKNIYEGLINLYRIFFLLEHQKRTEKHIANISKGAAAKRLNMFLRWMVRKDKYGVDFGIWDKISPANLFIPLDLHTGNVARMLGLLKRKQNDWKTVVELTDILKKFDPHDPVKYDFALFGIGVNKDF